MTKPISDEALLVLRDDPRRNLIYGPPGLNSQDFALQDLARALLEARAVIRAMLDDYDDMLRDIGDGRGTLSFEPAAAARLCLPEYAKGTDAP